MKRFAIIVVVIALGVAAGRYVLPAGSLPAKPSMALIEATPRWISEPQCVEMNAEERAREELVLRVLRDFPHISVMNIAAQRHFGRDQFRQTDDKRSVRLCPRSDLDTSIAELTLQQGKFSRSHLFDLELHLARRLGPRDTRIVASVAGTAFHPHPIKAESGVPDDIRSLARVTLAEFGTAAAPWSEQAYQAISSADELGTTAAQIAVSTGHPQALQKVAMLLDEILQKHSGNPIPRTARNRFYDLAYALAYVGPQARSHADPVLKIMDRQVESWAPPFGMVSLRPRRMCRVLELIGGPQTVPILAGDICRPKIDVYEQ
jgi:hypothetical protein